jgi:hypothetical protein
MLGDRREKVGARREEESKKGQIDQTIMIG